jgi:hypothetical protein
MMSPLVVLVIFIQFAVGMVFLGLGACEYVTPPEEKAEEIETEQRTEEQIKAAVLVEYFEILKLTNEQLENLEHLNPKLSSLVSALIRAKIKKGHDQRLEKLIHSGIQRQERNPL